MAAAPTLPWGELAAVVGRSHVRAATPADAVDGVPAGLVVEPASADEVGGVLQVARHERLAVCPRGGGSKLTYGNPPTAADLVLSTARLARIVEHSSGDLVVRTEAGVRLDALQSALRASGQRLALDPPEPAATVGGVVAANASGPLRLRYGTARDLVIGITIVLSDGTVAHAGGKVVKNVAGYDLGKLLCGSFGTLAVITDLTFRLHPVPATRRTVVLRLAGRRVGPAVQAVLRSPLTPSALELAWEGDERLLALLFEGGAPGCDAQAGDACRQLAPHGEAGVLEGADADALWARLASRPWAGRPLGLRLTAPIAALDDLVAAVRDADAAASVRAHAGTGVLHAGLTLDDPGAQAAVVEALRGRFATGDGSVVVTHASPAVRQGVDAFGPAGAALPLLRRVKQEFDPTGTLNPGRFLHGLG